MFSLYFAIWKERKEKKIYKILVITTTLNGPNLDLPLCVITLTLSITALSPIYATTTLVKHKISQ